MRSTVFIQGFQRAMASLLAMALALASVPTATANTSSLPNLGNGSELSLAAERRLGDRIAREIYRDPDYLDDPILSDYLQTLWQPLLAAAEQRGDVPLELKERFAWRLVISREREVNAFALPGGYLGVNLGLMASTQSADELASVLAHELSHVSQRHIARMISQQKQQAPWMIAAMILGALAAGSSKNSDVAGATIAGTQALAARQQLNFSRDMEREADRIGFGVATEAGFFGTGFVSLFERLQQASRYNDDAAFPYLRSHPLSTERMADMRARLPMQSAAAQPNPAPSVLTHALIAARAQVLAETDPSRWRAWAQSASGRDNIVNAQTLPTRLYTGALAALRLRDTEQAMALTTALARQLPTDDAQAQTVLEGLAVEVLLTAPNPSTARIAEKTLEDWSQRALQRGSRAGLLLRAQAVRVLGQTTAIEQTVQHLQNHVVDNPHDALAWQALSTLNQIQNQPLRAIRAAAEARVAQLDDAGAMERLKAAQNLIRDSARVDRIVAAIIDARMHEVRRQLRETEQQTREEQGTL